MAKFPLGRKKKSSDKKASKASKAEASPLMADEPKSSSKSSSSRSHLKNDEEREAQRKEREERRKQRDKRLADSKESSSKSKNKSKPRLSRAEQDAKDAKLGCCHKFQEVLVKIVHVIDFLIGLTFVIYGAVIHYSFENPAMEAVIATQTFGSVMLFTSAMGAIGFYSKVCSRCGLVLSGYTAPFIAFFYIFIIITLLSSPDTFFNYLNEHKDVMYLNEAELLTLRQILPFFYIVLASLAAIEIIRFLLLRKLRHELVRYDSASQRILGSQSSNKSKSSRSRSKRSSSNHSGSNLTEPLVGDEEEGKVEKEDY
eukprot:CAMPEP_0172530072 /NCGR_PEP_ID=MMETSP1067-20121228/3933_1 /TAXON_ID=265564 ORGANISM="Thalassiosira punctigera, Strain Tpunct2005C2" /NCGR_SAMPLE_ID=MMETSP1067 /ASSEMBLY_ACC=CAM_ASM_000444 /LENGTH=312 /DNA_ID=CAMNT_0013314215 /DNA_START=101 /DNA_END=1039 /DNA_ORIENTATION=+